MKQTRRPEDEEQLNKTPETPAAADAPQEEPAYSLEEIMNEFGGWTKRDAPAPAEPVTDETVRLAVPAAVGPDGGTLRLGRFFFLDRGEADGVAAGGRLSRAGGRLSGSPLKP